MSKFSWPMTVIALWRYSLVEIHMPFSSCKMSLITIGSHASCNCHIPFQHTVRTSQSYTLMSCRYRKGRNSLTCPLCIINHFSYIEIHLNVDFFLFYTQKYTWWNIFKQVDLEKVSCARAFILGSIDFPRVRWVICYLSTETGTFHPAWRETESENWNASSLRKGTGSTFKTEK